MIEHKWLELLKYLQDRTHEFEYIESIVELLNGKVVFLNNQFGNVNTINTPQFIDWIEHEAFSAVLNDVFKVQNFTETEINSLFNALISTKLYQLALSLVINNKGVIDTAEFDIKRGIILQHLGESEQAEIAFYNVISNSPKNYLGHFHLGYIRLTQGDTEQAVKCFTECTQLAPDFVGGFQNLAGCHYQASEFEQAIDSCIQVYKIDPTVTACYVTAISSFLALKQLERAKVWLDRARVHQIETIELNRLRGIWAHQSQHDPEAILALSEYLEARPEDIDILAIRAQALAADGQWEPLLIDLKVLLELDPHDAWSLEYLFLANFHTQRWAQAEVAMSQLSKISTHFKATYRSQMDEIRKQEAIVIVDIQ